MKSLFDFLFTFFISFENNCNNTTPLEANIDTDEKKKREGHLEISASASRHRHWNRHWRHHWHLNINIVFYTV